MKTPSRRAWLLPAFAVVGYASFDSIVLAQNVPPVGPWECVANCGGSSGGGSGGGIPSGGGGGDVGAAIGTMLGVLQTLETVQQLEEQNRRRTEDEARRQAQQAKARAEQQMQLDAEAKKRIGQRWFDLGTEAWGRGELEKAIEYFKEALRFAPGDRTVTTALGTVENKLRLQEQREARRKDKLGRMLIRLDDGGVSRTSAPVEPSDAPLSRLGLDGRMLIRVESLDAARNGSLPGVRGGAQQPSRGMDRTDRASRDVAGDRSEEPAAMEAEQKGGRETTAGEEPAERKIGSDASADSQDAAGAGDDGTRKIDGRPSDGRGSANAGDRGEQPGAAGPSREAGASESAGFSPAPSSGQTDLSGRSRPVDFEKPMPATGRYVDAYDQADAAAFHGGEAARSADPDAEGMSHQSSMPFDRTGSDQDGPLSEPFRFERRDTQ